MRTELDQTDSQQAFHCVFLGNIYRPEEGVWKPEGRPIGATHTPWEQLFTFLTEDRRVASKGEAKLFLPGKLIDEPVENEKGSTLLNENIEHLSFLAIDIEGGGTLDKRQPLLTEDDLVDILARLQSLPYETVFFNSFSDGAQFKGRRGRILVPFAAPVDPAQFGQTRKTQGKWWSRYIFMALAKEILGDCMLHPGVRAGLEGAKILAGKYYVRSAPKEPAAEPWLMRFNEGTYFDPTMVVAKASERANELQEIGERDATGLGIQPAKLKKVLKRWQDSDNPDENRAFQAMQKVMRGECEAAPGAGFDTNNLVCRLLAKHCSPFDPQVVARELFTKSSQAWAAISHQSLEHEVGYVTKNLHHWHEFFHKQAIDFAKETRAWRGRLAFKANGEAKSTTANVLLILDNHPDWEGVLGYNTRSETLCFMKRPPSEKRTDQIYPIAVTDADQSHVLPWLQSEVDISVESRAVFECMTAVARKNRFDPVKTYFNSLKWDGKPRLDTWLIECGGVADNVYTRAVSSRWMISAVARTYEPGCKADHMLVLESPQGCGKSTAFRTLCADPAWFTDHLPDMHSKEAFMALRGKLIVEVSELNAIARSTNEAQKKFLSSQVDCFRPPYARTTIDSPRHCVLGASTNTYRYTSDVTGTRRHWPVRITVERIDIQKLGAMRDQLWGEAVHRYHQGATWWLETTFLEKLAQREQSKRRQEDPFEGFLERYLHTEPIAMPKPEEVDNVFRAIGTALKVYRRDNGQPGGELLVFHEAVFCALGIDKAAHQMMGRRVSQAMNALGWEEGPHLRFGVERARTFVRKGAEGTEGADVVPIVVPEKDQPK